MKAKEDAKVGTSNTNNYDFNGFYMFYSLTFFIAVVTI